jgi:molecular chaperone GrpE (heat shock protein)
MSNCKHPGLAKWPFFLGDLALLVFAGFIVYQSAAPLGLWQTAILLVAVSLGACLGALPFLREYQAEVKLSEADALANTVAQIQNLEQIKTQIATATFQWHAVQEQSSQTVAAAKEIGDRMRGELDEFCAFLRKASDAERTHLRLEVEKLRRSEGEWLQVVVTVLDHVFALRQAALRANQPGPIEQLNKFQFACRDAARRMGVVAFEPQAGEPFDSNIHQLPDADKTPEAPAQIADILAVGFTYQGQLVRRALVTTRTDAPAGAQDQLELIEAPPSESTPIEEDPAQTS